MTLDRYRASRIAWLGFGLATSLVLSTVVPVQPARAQEDAVEQLSTAQQVAELFEKLDERLQKIDRLESDLRKEEGPAAALIRSQIIEQQGKYRRDLSKLTELLTEAPDGGLELEDSRKQLAKRLEADGQQLQTGLDAQEAQIRELVTIEDTGSADEKAKAFKSFPVEIEHANQLYQAYQQNLEDRRALGLDVSKHAAKQRERLERRAEFASGALQETKKRVDQIAKQPGLAEDAEAQKQLALEREHLGLLAESQRLTVDLLDEYGEDTADYRKSIISATGEISDDILNAEVAKGLAEESADDALSWLKTHGAGLLFKLGMFLLVLLLTWMLARIARAVTRRALARHRAQFAISSLAENFLIRAAGRLVWIFGIIVAISQVGIEIGPLLAGLGIAGFVVGFALQDTLSNFASGMMILLYRPFDIGDVIEAGGVMGTVNRMNLVSTMIVTPDNQMLVVPNNQIWGNVIRNVTHQTERRVDLTFGIGYSDDIEKAEQVLTNIIESHDKVLKDPKPVVRLHELADSSVNFVVRPWVKTSDYWDVYWDLTREVKRRFDEESISIPFPQTDVHLFRGDGSETAGPAAGSAEHSRTDLSAQTVDNDD